MPIRQTAMRRPGITDMGEMRVPANKHLAMSITAPIAWQPIVMQETLHPYMGCRDLIKEEVLIWYTRV